MLNSQLRSEPFLWIHLSGIVLFPIWLTVAWIALGVGNNFNPFVELFLLASWGILPVWLMQLTRPFNIFSILFVALKEECLSEEQRAILSLFKSFKQSFYSTIATVILVLTLWLLNRLAPLAAGMSDFLPQWRLLGLSLAIVALLLSSLFLQVPLSVLQVLLTSQFRLNKINPYPTEKIARNFTTPGIKVSNILWFLNLAPEAKKPLP